MPGLQNIMAGEGFIRTYDLLEALSNDVNTAFKVLEEDKQNQYFRRSVVRAVFSYVEAVIETIKVEVRSSLRLERPNFELSKKEVELLGSLFAISENKGRQLPLEQNLKSTFKLAAKVWDLDFRLLTDSEDYRDFVIAKSFRNKLTHPKTYYDIEVTDDDMHYHATAGMWVRAEFERLMKARVDSLEVYVNKYMVN
ncbi:TPA: hypothetical protein ACX3GK_004514 [Vibrio parahaemolyticus]|uniref:hypothetical protein n=1 Tax=Gammaproteobacteria TaxID=1236 RepID=UPI001BAE6A17|nr:MULTISPECIES: hypothetical protein [Gammaproteobacteria]MBE5123296.1 hypothetical protein [Vibrio parahaemolyticus]MBS3799144.1 hypothetical protein [Pseudoalteromonas sp. BDTF-M6]MDF4518492.1 hypothetical protein [Vibrio parahaemolyticus]MDF4522974.1 hypothetical protein [Vibrio parahaemolyticus]MDF4540996.1 hypothetical protein [Vibrio parahaemolyticus]